MTTGRLTAEREAEIRKWTRISNETDATIYIAHAASIATELLAELDAVRRELLDANRVCGTLGCSLSIR